LAAVVRYRGMFRTAAVIYLLLGASMAWRYGLTDYDPAHRPWGLGIGVLGLLVGVFLFRRARLAVGLSAIGAVVIAMAAAVAAPTMPPPTTSRSKPPPVVFGLYAALAGRALLER